MNLVALAAASVLVIACSSPPPRVVAPSPPSPPSLSVSAEVHRQVPPPAACGAGDACGFFLQVLSPGSNPTALAAAAVKRVGGRCGGHLVVYRDARSVMGAGIVFPREEDKHACERALGRAADTDFPRPVVLRVAP